MTFFSKSDKAAPVIPIWFFMAISSLGRTQEVAGLLTAPPKPPTYDIPGRSKGVSVHLPSSPPRAPCSRDLGHAPLPQHTCPCIFAPLFPLRDMPSVHALLLAEVLSVLPGLTQVPPLPRETPRFHWLAFSFPSRFSQDTVTASSTTSPVPLGDHHPFGRQGWVWDFLERLSACPSWRASRKHSVDHRRQTAGPRAQAERADFRH